jgi:hypothetical protein
VKTIQEVYKRKEYNIINKKEKSNEDRRVLENTSLTIVYTKSLKVFNLPFPSPKF